MLLGGGGGNGLLQLGQKKQRINQSKLKQNHKKKEKRTQNKSVLKTCVRRVEYDLRGCMGGFLVQGGIGKG